MIAAIFSVPVTLHCSGAKAEAITLPQLRDVIRGGNNRNGTTVQFDRTPASAQTNLKLWSIDTGSAHIDALKGDPQILFSTVQGGKRFCVLTAATSDEVEARHALTLNPEERLALVPDKDAWVHDLDPSVGNEVEPVEPVAPVPANGHLVPQAMQTPTYRPPPKRTVPTLDLVQALPGERLADARALVQGLAEELQVNVENVLAGFMVIVSGANCRTVKVSPKPGSQWEELASLWFAVVMESGDRKTNLLRMLSAPVREWSKRERELLRKALAVASNARKNLEKKQENLRHKFGKPPTDEQQAETFEAQLAADTEEIELKLGEPELDCPDLVVTTFTPEGLRKHLTKNGEKVIVLTSEVEPKGLLGAQYSKSGESNVATVLSLHSGDADNSIRASYGLPPLHEPAGAMGLFLPPSTIKELMSRPEVRSRGFAGRLHVVHPVSLMGSRRIDSENLPADLGQKFHARIGELLDQPWPGKVVLTKETVELNDERKTVEVVRLHAGPPVVLSFTPEAQTQFDRYRQLCESQLNDFEEEDARRSYRSKQPGEVARFALNLQRYADPQATVIDSEILRGAVYQAEHLWAHFLLVLGETDEPEAAHFCRLAKALKKVIEKRRGEKDSDDTISARDAFTKTRKKPDMDTMEDFDEVLAEAVDRGLLSELNVPQNPKGGRPSKSYRINLAALFGP